MTPTLTVQPSQGPRGMKGMMGDEGPMGRKGVVVSEAVPAYDLL